MCTLCLDEGKPEREARVAWSEFQADHVIPHSKGGQTIVENAQVLCRYHNVQKGANS
jgi:5-methylcytosine-specific restriction endonuclease McrA